MIDKEKFIELACEIAEWHEQTFPDADEDGQVLKLSEEFEEWRQEEMSKDDSDSLKEMADVFIVSGVLCFRYSNALGSMVFNWLFDGMTQNEIYELLEAVQTKMEINRRRKWVKLSDGRYKHVEREKE